MLKFNFESYRVGNIFLKNCVFTFSLFAIQRLLILIKLLIKFNGISDLKLGHPLVSTFNFFDSCQITKKIMKLILRFYTCRLPLREANSSGPLDEQPTKSAE